MTAPRRRPGGAGGVACRGRPAKGTDRSPACPRRRSTPAGTGTSPPGPGCARVVVGMFGAGDGVAVGVIGAHGGGGIGDARALEHARFPGGRPWPLTAGMRVTPRAVPVSTQPLPISRPWTFPVTDPATSACAAAPSPQGSMPLPWPRPWRRPPPWCRDPGRRTGRSGAPVGRGRRYQQLEPRSPRVSYSKPEVISSPSVPV